MKHAYAQTNVQLYEQLRHEGYTVDEIERVFSAYCLAMDLFGGQFRGSGKTFLSHLIGTSSILADLNVPIQVIIAGLLHAAYSDGTFTGLDAGVSEAKRRHLQDALGKDVEDLIFRYAMLEWRSTGAIIRLHEDVAELHATEQVVIVMRLANELEEHLDLASLYCSNSDDRRLFAELYGTHIAELADKLGYPALGVGLRQVFGAIQESEVPELMRASLDPGYQYQSRGVKLSPVSKSSRPGVTQPDVPAGEGFCEFTAEELNRSLPERFEMQVEFHQHRTAIDTGSDKLTYAQLNVSANAIARTIRDHCSEAASPVAVVVSQASLPVAMLAVLKAGQICVPLSSSHPPERLRRLLGHIRPICVLADQFTEALCDEIGEQTQQLLNVDVIDKNLASENLGLAISPDDPAIVLFTSGSTGQPKGVVHSHRSLMHLVMRTTNTLRIDSNDRFSMVSAGTHIAGVTDILRSLLNGAVLLPLDVAQQGLDALSEWLRAKQVSVFHLTPTLFRSLAQTFSPADRFPTVRFIHLGGEPASANEVAIFKRFFEPHSILMNNLGCTEFSGYCQYRMSSTTVLPKSVVPAGYPVDDVEVTLLDESGAEVADGAVGEIVITSPYLALGYWRDPAHTNAVFRVAPGNGSVRSYRTGDLARRLTERCYVHAGRVDDQVQIRGYRVELGEIEATLLECSQLKQALARTWRDSAGGRYLVAYVVLNGLNSPTPAELRDFLSDRLPSHMIPATFVTINSLPLTVTGKVDRSALPAPDHSRSRMDAPLDAPTTAVERALTNLWKAVLQVDEIGIHDDFFELGGDSLQAMRVISRLSDQFNIAVPLRVFFDNRTIARFAGAVLAMSVADTLTRDSDQQTLVAGLLADVERLSAEAMGRHMEDTISTDINESGLISPVSPRHQS